MKSKTPHPLAEQVFEHGKLLLTNRFIVLGIFFCAFLLAQYFASGFLLPSPETRDIWFYSGLFMVLFSVLFIEPYYASPKNVITNSIPLLLVFLAIKTTFNNPTFWWFAIAVLLALVLASITAMTLEDKDKSPESTLFCLV